MKKIIISLCLVFVLLPTALCLAEDPILIGNFEDGSTGSGSDTRYDNWMDTDFVTYEAVTSPAVAITLGTHAIKLVDEDGGWGANFTKPFGEYGNTLESNIYYQAMFSDGAAISANITAFPGEVPSDVATLSLFINGDGYWGDFADTTQTIIVDGVSHAYDFYISQDVKDAIEGTFGGWGCNMGFLLSTGSGSATLYIDSIWIYPDGPINVYGPYNSSVEQDFNVDPDYVDFTLSWYAGKDPGDPNRMPDPNLVYAVNPDIVDEYVFRYDGSETDPNYYYVGATGVDPGTDDPNSSYGPIVLPINSVFSWVVVEAMDGYEQTLTEGTSSLLDVDPNNIIGPMWTYPTLSTIPTINVQPVSKRFAVDDTNAQFTIDVTSNTTPIYQWYYSKDAVKDEELGNTGVDNAIGSSIGGDTDTLTISAHNKAYQAYYYCKIANASTVGGGLGGTEPDVYSDIVSLVVERKVADYKFDGDLTDDGDGNTGTGVGSPTYVTGADGVGSALSLDGSTQYVLIPDADPNNAAKCFPRADLVGEKGIGGALDIGSISCWVKLNATVADQVSPIMYNGNDGWPATVFQFQVSTDSDAANTDLLTAIWGDDEELTMVQVNPQWADPFNLAGDGQWHMLASIWDSGAGTISAYVDGSLLSTWTATPSSFSAWNTTMKIGFNGTDYFGGAIDNLKVYNYAIAPEDIALEYSDVTGQPGCIYLDFDGSLFNVDNTGSSYCQVDLADFAVLAASWLNNGYYPAP